jgi:hypothetical protein
LEHFVEQHTPYLRQHLTEAARLKGIER